MGAIVAKFGGTSLADHLQIEKAKEIIKANPKRKYIVVSAPGRRFERDNKVTDLLYSCKTHMEHNLPYEQLFQAICDRFGSIGLHLGVDVGLNEELEEIKNKLENGASYDYIASRGEYLNAKLIAAYLGYDFVDAKDVIKFDRNGRLLEEETDEAIANELKNHKGAVIPGFYGSKPDGEIKTFSRGGSDVTGSLVARAINAEVYENWTDVSGFLVADPRIIPDARPINTISYKELRELSYMGASVLHEDAIFPARASNIPINIRNTNEPDNPGTMITSEPTDEGLNRVVTGIAGRKDFVVIGIYKNHLATERGFVRKLAAILEENEIYLEHIPSGIDTLSVVVSQEAINGKMEDVLEEIRLQLHPDTIEVNENMALIATVGCGMSFRPGVSAKLFTALADAGVNIRMIDQGSSEMNIIVGVHNEDFEKSIRAIYHAFFD